jgi:hypothetical protein
MGSSFLVKRGADLRQKLQGNAARAALATGVQAAEDETTVPEQSLLDWIQDR